MSISDETLREIRTKFGGCSSWGVWSPEGSTPKSNVGDLSVFDFAANPKVRDSLHADIVAVGLNISGDVTLGPFENFHSASPAAQDFKLRYAFTGTPAWGCYMTDILKNFPEISSQKVRSHIKRNPESLIGHFSKFREEVEILNANKSLFLGLGGVATELLRMAMPTEAKILQAPHYSAWQFNKESYREKFQRVIS